METMTAFKMTETGEIVEVSISSVDLIETWEDDEGDSE